MRMEADRIDPIVDQDKILVPDQRRRNSLFRFHCVEHYSFRTCRTIILEIIFKRKIIPRWRRKSQVYLRLDRSEEVTLLVIKICFVVIIVKNLKIYKQTAKAQFSILKKWNRVNWQPMVKKKLFTTTYKPTKVWSNKTF